MQGNNNGGMSNKQVFAIVGGFVVVLVVVTIVITTVINSGSNHNNVSTTTQNAGSNSSSSANSSLVGNWIQTSRDSLQLPNSFTQQGQVFNFMPDGTLIIGNITAQWQVVNNSALKYTIGDNICSYQMNFSDDKSALALDGSTFGSFVVVKLKRQ